MIKIAKVEWDLNISQQGLPPITAVNQTMKIAVTLTDLNWEYIKISQTTWNAIKNNFQNWEKVKET